MGKSIIYNCFKGCLYGQAVGDALGLGTEGMTDEDMAWKYPHGLQHYGQIFQDRHRKRWKIGDWTDDTDMMLCIAHAVIEDKGVNFTNIARHFKAWAEGEPMGIGENTYKVLNIADYVEKPYEVSRMVWKMSRYQSAANGGVMRTSVVGLFPNHVTECAENICKLTHYDPRCVGSCVIVSNLIHALVYGSQVPSYQDMIDTAMEYDERIADYIELAWKETDITKLMDDDHMGYTLVTLSVALWAYWHASSFEDGLLAVVNAGGDADTNAAVACAILGAKFGFNSIPQEYVKGLIYRDQLDDVVEGLWHICDMRQDREQEGFVHRFFYQVANSLNFIARQTGLTYNEINILVYYLFIPLTWVVLLDISLKHPLATPILIIAWLSIWITKKKHFGSWCDKVFDKSVQFLLFFNRLGWGYEFSSVVICVLLPLLVYIVLIVNIIC